MCRTAGRGYYAEPGLIVLDEVTNEAMTEAVNELWQEGYFERLKPAEWNRTSRRRRPAGITAFRGLSSPRPARLLNLSIRPKDIWLGGCYG
jgi:hypothetical protein